MRSAGFLASFFRRILCFWLCSRQQNNSSRYFKIGFFLYTTRRIQIVYIVVFFSNNVLATEQKKKCLSQNTNFDIDYFELILKTVQFVWT